MSMKIVQSVYGKFWHFHLARHLHQRDMLESIFSSYPRQKLKDQGIPAEKIHTFPWIHVLWMAHYKSPLSHRAMERKLGRLLATTLDGYVARNLPECDVLVAISGSGVRSGKLNQQRGGKYICDRGSSHIRYADIILKEEFKRWNQEFPGVDPFHIRREEQEYEQADAITVPSEFVRRSFLEMGVEEAKLRKVPYGADLARFSKVGEPPKDVFEVLFVGQVSFRKGVPYLLEAFKAFSHPHKRLRIVGDILPEMKKFLAETTWENVEFLGALPHLRLKQVMSRSHVMVLPSIEEGLAMVQGEAMACACPLISSYNTGAEDLFNDGEEGFIIPIRDAKIITERLEQLAQDPDLRLRMSETAQRRVVTLGGWQTYGDLFIKELELLMKPVAATS